jgi:hypothetical protein
MDTPIALHSNHAAPTAVIAAAAGWSSIAPFQVQEISPRE